MRLIQFKLESLQKIKLSNKNAEILENLIVQGKNKQAVEFLKKLNKININKVKINKIIIKQIGD